METEDILGVIVLACVVAFTASAMSYTVAHRNGYEKGVSHTQIYYETMGEFPSLDWIEENEASHINYSRQIEESLERYKPISKD